MLAQLTRHIEAQSKMVIDLQRALVAIPALGPMNGGAGEKDKTEFLKGYLRDMGFAKVRELRAPDPAVPCGYRPSLCAVVPGTDTSKTFWVISHPDIVPPGDLALWDSDPYTLKVEGDILIGRGVEDNHQGIVCSLLVAGALLDQGLTPPINYGVLLVADEETGSKYGLDYVVKQHADLFGPTDLFLVPDFGEPTSEMIEIAEKSMFWLKVVVEGKQCHASTPDAGINSLVAASALIVQIPKLRQIFDRTDPLFNPPYSTFEPTKKEANVENINTPHPGGQRGRDPAGALRQGRVRQPAQAHGHRRRHGGGLPAPRRAQGCGLGHADAQRPPAQRAHIHPEQHQGRQGPGGHALRLAGAQWP